MSNRAADINRAVAIGRTPPTPTLRDIFLAFLKLGVSSFGGPIAHLGYLRSEFVDRRRWLDDAAHGDLVALCQFLPGPASSQVGIALGASRAGLSGAIVAWLGFTLPSAVIMIAFGYGFQVFQGMRNAGWLHGLKIAAVARPAPHLGLVACASRYIVACAAGVGRLEYVCDGAALRGLIVNASCRACGEAPYTFRHTSCRFGNCISVSC